MSFKKAVRALRAFDGVVEIATEAELADASRPRRSRRPVHVPAHRRRARARSTKLAARGEVTRDHRVVVISTASGLKFADFKVGYHEGTLADVPAPRYRNVPVELPERYDAVRDALHARPGLTASGTAMPGVPADSRFRTRDGTFGRLAGDTGTEMPAAAADPQPSRSTS